MQRLSNPPSSLDPLIVEQLAALSAYSSAKNFKVPLHLLRIFIFTPTSFFLFLLFFHETKKVILDMLVQHAFRVLRPQGNESGATSRLARTNSALVPSHQ